MNEARYREAESRLWASIGLRPTERDLRLRTLDTTVRVQEHGDGPTILFVHGGSSSGANWAPMLPFLDGFRCVLLDRPGCGLSPPLGADLRDAARFLAAADALVGDVVEALDLDRAAVVATSLGGFYALRGAAARADRVERIVEFGFTIGAPMTHIPLSIRIATLPGLQRVMTRIPPTRSAVRAILRQLGHGPALTDGRVTPEFFDWFLALLRHTRSMRNDTNAPRKILQPQGSAALLPADVVADVRCPVRFVWGEDDPLGGADVAERFVRRFPAAELELWPAAGHAPWIGHPERAADRVADFLRS